MYILDNNKEFKKLTEEEIHDLLVEEVKENRKELERLQEEEKKIYQSYKNSLVELKKFKGVSYDIISKSCEFVNRQDSHRILTGNFRTKKDRLNKIETFLINY